MKGLIKTQQDDPITVTTTDYTGPFTGTKTMSGSDKIKTVPGALIQNATTYLGKYNVLPYKGVKIQNYGAEKYDIIELDRDDVPIAVYISGSMVTLGILGTDVECAFTEGKLIFEPGCVGRLSFGDRITMSIEWKDEMCHYNIGYNGVASYVPGKPTTLITTKVSTISKKGNDNTGTR